MITCLIIVKMFLLAWVTFAPLIVIRSVWSHNRQHSWSTDSVDKWRRPTYVTVQLAASGCLQMCSGFHGQHEASTAAPTLLHSGRIGLGSPLSSGRCGDCPEPGPGHQLQTRTDKYIYSTYRHTWFGFRLTVVSALHWHFSQFQLKP